jgi:hypothetical protein
VVVGSGQTFGGRALRFSVMAGGLMEASKASRVTTGRPANNTPGEFGGVICFTRNRRTALGIRYGNPRQPGKPHRRQWSPCQADTAQLVKAVRNRGGSCELA